MEMNGMETVEVRLDQAKLEIGYRYVIIQTDEGVDVSPAHHELVMETVSKYTEFPVAFVLDEVNSYSVKLETLLAIREEQRVSRFGVISYRPATRVAFTLGSALAKRPVTFLESRDQVMGWLDYPRQGGPS